ncbi:MAG: nucleoside triphosphate pyrophosphohydrolase family protein [Ktedonobacteraceae bacterium]
MNIREYTKEVHRTCSIEDPRELLILTALGIAGESGEVVNALKKVLYHAHTLNAIELGEEIGDLLWYIVLLCDTVGLSLDDVIQANVEKLRKRYPQGFDVERSRSRLE